MRYPLCISLFSSLLPFLSLPSSLSAHDVGEPLLEELSVWKSCCGGHDCVPQKVKVIGQEGKEKVSVEIEGSQTRVDKGKLSPVPSRRAWVCYVNRNGEIVNENIRCILLPEARSTVQAPVVP